MRRLIMLIVAAVGTAVMYAATYNYKFTSTKLSDALSRIAEDHRGLRLNFIYNELENYRTSATVDTEDAYELLRQTVGYNPVTVTVRNGRFYVEALQKGKYVYTGLVEGSDGKPVEAATVMLLSPKDSTVVTYGITDEEGRFGIPCDKTDVMAKLTCLGYMPRYVDVAGYSLGTIIMEVMPVSLRKLEVDADYTEVYPDKSVYVPTSRQRNSSQNGIDLLRAMAIPQIRVSLADNSVSTLTNQEVKIYINYVEATPEALAGMRMADVKRVEYYTTPSDPRFMGNRNVINFTVQEYEYGGYTKVSGYETFLTGLSSNVSVYSKFAYKKMTYDLYAGSANTSNRHSGSTTRSQFRLLQNDGEPQVIDREEATTKSRKENDRYPISLRATYTGEKFQASNTVGLTINNTPCNNQEGRLRYEPSLTEGGNNEFSNKFSNRSKTGVYSGSWAWTLPRNFSLTATPNGYYSRTKQRGIYGSSALEAPIMTDADERSYGLHVAAVGQKIISGVHYLIVRGFAGSDNYKVSYSGSSPATDRIKENYEGGSFCYGYYADKVYADFLVGISSRQHTTNTEKMDDTYPFGQMSFGWSPNRKHTLNGYLVVSKEPMESDHKSRNIIRQNELLYYTGNPILKNSRNVMGSVSYTWVPTQWLTVSPMVAFYMTFDREVPVYSLYDDGRAILRRYENDGDHYRTTTALTVTANLLNRSLVLQARPMRVFTKSTGYYNMSFNPWAVEASATYYMSRLYFSVNYQKYQGALWTNSGTIFRDCSQFQLNAGWSKEDLNVRVGIANPWRWNWHYSSTEFVTPYYSQRVDNNAVTGHCNLSLSVPYTLGYGKKVRRGNEMGAQGGGNSAIRK